MSSDPCLPSVLAAHYTNLELVATGNFGEIYHADSVPSDSSMGLSSTSATNPSTRVTLRTFREKHRQLDELDLSELEILSQLSHENIVKIIDTVWHIRQDKCVELFLITSHCNGGDLATLMSSKGAFSEAQLRKFAVQIVGGIGELRKNGIVVRDLRPDTILVHHNSSEFTKSSHGDDSVVYKICDLGLTRLFFDDNDDVGMALGPEYGAFRAPELVFRAESNNIDDLQRLYRVHHESKADLWSLGVLLLYCLYNEIVLDTTHWRPDQKPSLNFIRERLERELASLPLVELITSLVQIEPDDRVDFGHMEDNLFLGNPMAFVKPLQHIIPCSAPITALAADQNDVVAGLETGHIEIYCRKNSNFSRRKLTFHRKTVSALALNNEIIVSGSQDTSIAVWLRSSGERLQVLYHHRNTVIGIEIIGSDAYSACLDGSHKAFSIDFRKLHTKRNGFAQRRTSLADYASEQAFVETIDFYPDNNNKIENKNENKTDDKVENKVENKVEGLRKKNSLTKVYKAQWREHDHMHSVAGLIVLLIWVEEDKEFRPFHVLSSRAFSHLRPQLELRTRTKEGEEKLIRRLNVESHVRQVVHKGDQVLMLHWDGHVSLWRSKQLLDTQLINEKLTMRMLIDADQKELPTWFCLAGNDSFVYYAQDALRLLEYRL